MKTSEIIELQRRGNSGDLYQIGLPAYKLSTVFMLWISYERPCIILVHPSRKNDEWAVIEFRNDILANEIISVITDSMVKIVKEPLKNISI